jgi:putative FmdB family regulatory protein
VPIYEYKCAKCGNELEVMHKVSDPNPTECPECHEPALARLMSRTSFQLKGGGWGSDLYASAKKDGASSTPATTSAASTGTGTGATASTTTPTAAPATPVSSGSGTTGGGSSGSGGSST